MLVQFSAAMDQSVSPDGVFQPSDGDWDCGWDSATSLGCTLTGGVEPGDSISASYTLTGLKTATGAAVADFDGDILLMAAGGADAPVLTAPPAIVSGKVNFVFSVPMDPAGIDVKLEGPGIDQSKVTFGWFTFPGVPTQILEGSSAGGWPPQVQVMWTINAGDSGKMKSAEGVAVETATRSRY